LELIIVSIEIIYEDGFVSSVIINGGEYFSEGEDEVCIPMSAFSGISTTALPLNLPISICESCDDRLVILHNVPTIITRKDENLFHIAFDELITRKYWDAPVGLKLWMETKRDIVSERKVNLGDVTLEDFDDDGVFIRLSYSALLHASSFEDLFNSIDSLYNEIEGATDIAPGSP